MSELTEENKEWLEDNEINGDSCFMGEYFIPRYIADIKILEMQERIYDLEQQLKQQWVSVDDGMPEINDECLIMMEVKPNIERGVYVGDGDWKANWCARHGKNQCYNVTHWMPLPKPPTK